MAPILLTLVVFTRGVCFKGMTQLEFTVTKNENPATAEERAAILANPAFGRQFTDHMVTIDWTEDKGWHNAQVRPYENLSFDPASMVFHYGCLLYTSDAADEQVDV